VTRKIKQLEVEGAARAPVPHSWRRQCQWGSCPENVRNFTCKSVYFGGFWRRLSNVRKQKTYPHPSIFIRAIAPGIDASVQTVGRLAVSISNSSNRDRGLTVGPIGLSNTLSILSVCLCLYLFIYCRLYNVRVVLVQQQMRQITSLIPSGI